MKITDYTDSKKHELNKNIINAYVCGPTVYSSIHIGNLRPILIMDILGKALRFSGIELNLVHNITDIDDKIIEKSLELNISERELTKKILKEYMEILNLMNIDTIKYMPKVTDNINEIINFIDQLIKKEFAYESNGSVYFNVNKISNYGKKHRINKNELEVKQEEFNDQKMHQNDFALWKKTTVGETWKSKWGKGRPGWHTECVTFISEYFDNNTIDIHGGGIDLRFPHHVNEEAQFFAFAKKELSKYYAYTGQIMINSQKMSKSLGNEIVAKEFIKKHGSAILRMSLISANYRKPININNNLLENSEKEITKLENCIRKAFFEIEKHMLVTKEINHFVFDVSEALLDDINITRSLTIINSLVKQINNSDVFDNEYAINFNSLINSLQLLGFKIELFNPNSNIKLEELFAKKDYENIDKIRKEIIVKIF